MWFVLGLCTLAALADVLGGLLMVVRRVGPRSVTLLTSLGAGFLLGATLLDRLPDALHELPNVAPWFVTVGYLTLLALEHMGNGRSKHHHGGQDTKGPRPTGHAVTAEVWIDPKAAALSFVGLLFHTFMDGVIIAGGFALSPATGWLMFVAIMLHKIPEGFSMATISLAAGTSRWRAFLTTVGLAISTLAGAIVMLRLGVTGGTGIKLLMALATGSFLYIATSDLIPAVRHEGYRAVLCILTGVGLFSLSLWLLRWTGLS